MELKIVSAKDLTFNPNKWNGCVHYAMNGTPYGYTWMLDAVSKDWFGIIENDYQSVMPFFFKKNIWGKKVIYLPDTIQKTGLYSVNVLSQKRLENFLDFIPGEFRIEEIELYGIGKNLAVRDFRTIQLLSSSLLLNKPYEELHNQYSPHLKRLLEENQQEYIPSGTIKPEVFAGMLKKNGLTRYSNERAFHSVQRIIYNFLHRGTGNIFGLTDKEGRLTAAAFIIYSHNIIWIPYIASVSKESGEHGIPVLIDGLIRTHAGRQLVLDYPQSKGKDLSSDFNTVSDEYIRLAR